MVILVSLGMALPFNSRACIATVEPLPWQPAPAWDARSPVSIFDFALRCHCGVDHDVALHVHTPRFRRVNRLHLVHQNASRNALRNRDAQLGQRRRRLQAPSPDLAGLAFDAVNGRSFFGIDSLKSTRLPFALPGSSGRADGLPPNHFIGNRMISAVLPPVVPDGWLECAAGAYDVRGPGPLQRLHSRQLSLLELTADGAAGCDAMLARYQPSSHKSTTQATASNAAAAMAIIDATFWPHRMIRMPRGAPAASRTCASGTGVETASNYVRRSFDDGTISRSGRIFLGGSGLP